MKINMNLKNYGTVNIGENIENNYFNINIIKELNILKENCKNIEDEETINHAIDLIKNNRKEKAKEVLSKLGKSTLGIIKELSLSILKDFISSLI